MQWQYLKFETSGTQDATVWREEKQKLRLELVLDKMANSFSYDTALGYKRSSVSVQKVEGELFVQSDVSPEARDAILGLSCGTRQLSTYLAELLGPQVAQAPLKTVNMTLHNSFKSLYENITIVIS